MKLDRPTLRLWADRALVAGYLLAIAYGCFGAGQIYEIRQSHGEYMQTLGQLYPSAVEPIGGTIK